MIVKYFTNTDGKKVRNLSQRNLTYLTSYSFSDIFSRQNRSLKSFKIFGIMRFQQGW